MNIPNKLAKRNHYVSYLKGWAIISIMLIHLLDWSNINLSAWQIDLKELLYPAVLFFMATAGSVVFIAYNKYDLPTASRKLWRRGIELILVYFLYNLAKLWFYDFSRQPFYWQFSQAGKLNLMDILTLQSFTAPISIILTIGIFLLLAPLPLYLAKRKFPKISVGLLLAAVVASGYFLPLPANNLTDWLLAKSNIMFPVLLWSVPFLLGFYLSLLGFDKRKGVFLVLFSILAALCVSPILDQTASLRLSANMYPLKLYYVFLSFAFMFLLVYFFYFLEKIGGKTINFILSLFRLMGDSTLAIYIYHWLVVDLTIWLFYPRCFYIWYTAPVFLAVYLLLKRKRFWEYFKSYQKMV